MAHRRPDGADRGPADGRVELDGPLALGRKLLRLLALDDIAVKAPKERRAERPAPAG
jgi:hypothetical protein